jgi:hypothetical protein
VQHTKCHRAQLSRVGAAAQASTRNTRLRGLR